MNGVPVEVSCAALGEHFLYRRHFNGVPFVEFLILITQTLDNVERRDAVQKFF